MAFQGRRSGRESHGAGRLSERDQDFFAAGDIVNGADEGLFGASLIISPGLIRR